MLRKTIIAVVAAASVGMLAPNVALARGGGGGGGGGGHGGGGFGGGGFHGGGGGFGGGGFHGGGFGGGGFRAGGLGGTLGGGGFHRGTMASGGFHGGDFHHGFHHERGYGGYRSYPYDYGYYDYGYPDYAYGDSYRQWRLLRRAAARAFALRLARSPGPGLQLIPPPSTAERRSGPLN